MSAVLEARPNLIEALDVGGREREVRDTLWLIACVAWVLVPLSESLPFWCVASVWSLLIWRTTLTLTGRRPPPRFVLLALMLAAGLSVFVQYRTIFGKDAGVAYIALLSGLKLLELRARRDILVVIILSLFIMLTALFDSQSMGMAAWLFGGVLGLVTALLRVNLGTREPTFWTKLKMSLHISLLALPLMAVLFLFFPRIQGPLWGMPSDSLASRTGLSDSMSPGSFGRLIESDRVAFRVRFDGPAPPGRLRYWRGPVFGSFDGRTWRRLPSELIDSLGPQEVEADPASAYSYTVELPAGPRAAAYLLDLPQNPPDIPANPAHLTADFELHLSRHPEEPFEFTARSFAKYRYGTGLPESRRDIWLALPAQANPRTRALALELRAAEPDDRKLIERVLQMIRTENFVYTPQPPLLGDDPVDGFLFDTRRGFCEHFASAFVVLMRDAGIPARVVTGYQGGELNPLTNEMTVRQKDAHAWAEVWLAGAGWVRVDPTAAVAPSRIELGYDQSQEAEQGLSGAFVASSLNWMRWVRFRLDAVNGAWNRWIVAYTQETQRSLMSHWNMPDVDWRGLTIALIASFSVLLALVSAEVLLRRERPDPVVALYSKLCGVVGRRAAPRNPSEGPRDYLARVQPMLGEMEGARVAQAFDLYERLRYAAGPAEPGLLKAFRACVNALR